MKQGRFPAILALVLVLGCLFSPLHVLAASASGTGEMPEAETLAAQVDFSSSMDSAAVRDQNRNTYLSLPAGEEIQLSAESPFCYIYLVWDAPPAPYTVQAEGETLAGGTHGFLHEAIPLPTETTEATIVLAQAGEGYTLCDVYLFGAGSLPGWVQQWQPPLNEAELLVLPTHADDEHLFFGGILPTYAGERGMAVQVVYMTNHFAERYRPHELLDGLWTVGVTAYPIMGPFADLYASKESLSAAEQVYGREEVLRFQVEMLRRFKPQVVVGHDLAGEYGHGAHMLNAETLLQALEYCGNEEAFPESAEEYGVWMPDKVYLHLYAENEIVMDWNLPLKQFEGATAFEMAVEGFARHASQQEWFSVQQSGTWQDCRRFGLAHSTVGPDVAGDDLFENVPPRPQQAPLLVVPNDGAASSEPPADTASSMAQTDDTAKDSQNTRVILIGVVAVFVLAGAGAGLLLARRRKRK